MPPAHNVQGVLFVDNIDTCSKSILLYYIHMNKFTLSSVVAGLVIIGTSVAVAANWTAPTAAFPNLGGVTAPLDEGDTAQNRGGAIDFSKSTKLGVLVLGQNQGISLPSGGVLSILGGGLKLPTAGTGITFPDGTTQTTASTGGGASLGKVCNMISAAGNDLVNVPDGWQSPNCLSLSSAVGGTNFQLGCLLSDGTNSFGAVGGGNPANNCGWSSSCGTGPYYPYAPAGCLAPQKVFGAPGLASVSSGATSITWTHSAINSKLGILYCRGNVTEQASSGGCGQVLTQGFDENGNSCGDLTYEVYCR